MKWKDLFEKRNKIRGRKKESGLLGWTNLFSCTLQATTELTIDTAINCCNFDYISWKYWQLPKYHCDALCVLITLKKYLECATEPLSKMAFGITDNEKFQVLYFHDFRSITTFKSMLLFAVVFFLPFLVLKFHFFVTQDWSTKQQAVIILVMTRWEKQKDSQRSVENN